MVERDVHIDPVDFAQAAMAPDLPLGHLPTEDNVPLTERFPRQMLFEFTDDHSNPSVPVAHTRLLEAVPNAFPEGPIEDYYDGKPQGFRVGERIGSDLNDSAYANDGYRFHDALHISNATIIGWSPVLRSLLNIKRRSLPETDRIEDGGRATLLEENLFARLGIGTLEAEDSYFAESTLQIAMMTTKSNLEAILPPNTFIGLRELEKSIKIGYNVLYLLKDTIGVVRNDETSPLHRAYVHCDLDQQALRFSTESAAAARTAAPIQPINPLWYDKDSNLDEVIHS